MVTKCCGPTCACKINAGSGVTISGSGTANEPFVITANMQLAVQDNSTFNLTLTGDGSAATPYSLTVAYAATAKLDDLPDVVAPTPTNGQVLGWDSATSKWTNRAPTTAASGSVQHDTSMLGDGSAGTPLQINEDPARYLATVAAGLGLSDEAVNSLVRSFVDYPARDGFSAPTPRLNTLSMLDTNPGVVEYFDGTTWRRIDNGYSQVVEGGQLLSLSGAYVLGQAVVHWTTQISTETDPNGVFTVIPADTLTNSVATGVLSAVVQPVGSGGSFWHCMVYPATDHVEGIAWNATDGTPLASQTITATVLFDVY
jgi:hypothetical protein